MPFLLVLGLAAAGILLFAGTAGGASQAVKDASQAIGSQGRGGRVLFFPLADSNPGAVVMVGMPVWVYGQTTDGTEAYYQLVVTTIPPTGQTDFGLSDSGDPVLETFLPRSHFAVGEPAKTS